jgi:hypothetical protein
MTTKTKVSELLVVGYNDALDAELLPAVVAPVFASIGHPEKMLFPPFKLVGEEVHGGTWESIESWQHLRSLGDMTALDKPMTAQPNFELWLDLDGKPQYELRSVATRKLKTLAKEYVAQAEAALSAGQQDEALRLAAIAFNADHDQYRALAIEAAICHLLGKGNEVPFLKEMVAKGKHAAFDALVTELRRTAPKPSVLPPRKRKGSRTGKEPRRWHPMHNIASMRTGNNSHLFKVNAKS